MSGESARWMRLRCRCCGAHAVVMQEAARDATCPVCGAEDLEELGAESEAPRRHRA